MSPGATTSPVLSEGGIGWWCALLHPFLLPCRCLDVDRYRILSARDLLTHTFVATPLKQGGTRMEVGGVRRVSKTGVPIPGGALVSGNSHVTDSVM